MNMRPSLPLHPRGRSAPRASLRTVATALLAAVGATAAATACSSAAPGSATSGAEESAASTGLASVATAELRAGGFRAHLLTTDSGASIQVVNPTADDRFVIYEQTTTDDAGAAATSLLALPLDGGEPTTIVSSLAARFAVVVDQSTVFLWNNLSATYVGDLTVWTAASGARLASLDSAAYMAAASPDSRHVVFSSDVNAAGTFGNLVSASPEEPRRHTKLLEQTGLLGNPSFIPSLVFQPSGTPNPSSPGFVSNEFFVTSHEEEGSSTVTLSSWDAVTWQRHDLIVGAASNTQLALQNWNADAQGRHIAGLTTAGQLEVVPVEGPATDAWIVGPASGTTTFALQSDGKGIVFGGPPPPSEVSPAAPLFTEQRSAPEPSQVVATGFGGLYFPWENGALGPSPDARHVLYFSAESASFGYLYSLTVVANAPSSTPVTIDSSLTATVPGDPFTTDSRYVIYLTNVDTSTGLGELRAWDIEAERAIAVAPGAVSCNAVEGSEIVYNDDYDGNAGGATGAADLKTVDLSSGTLHPVTIQAGADATYYLTPDRSRVVYTLTASADPSANGIYVYTFDRSSCR